jgi:hypothetical protein
MDATDRSGKPPLDKPLVACLIAGAIVGIMLTAVAGIESSTPGPLPPPGDAITLVTSTFSVFGLAVRESTGPWAEHSRRFGQFHTIVGLVFVIAGLLTGLIVYLIGFRRRA